MENKLDKLKKILEVSSRDTISAKEIEQFLVLVLTTIKKERELFNNISDKQKNDIEQNLKYIEEVKNELSETIDNSLETTVSSFEKELQAVKDLIKNIELTPGKKGDKGDSIKGDDGYTPVKGVDYNDGSPDTGEKIVDKINSLETDDDDLKIDATHIKNLPKMVQNQIGGVVARNIYQMGDVALTSLANNDTLIWDDTNKLWVNGVGGSGGGHVIEDEGTPLTQRTNLNFTGAGVSVADIGGKTVVTINGGGGTIDGSGTTNELTYWVDSDTLGTLAVATYPSLTELSYVKGVTSAIQTQLNAKLTSSNIVETITNGVITNAPSENAVFDALALKEPLKGADDNYVTDAQLVVIGNTSGTNTGDQDLSTLAPKTSPTFATSITGSYLTVSEILITDGSKNIVSAPVATYPSLTELTYLKGVTSAIQTQLNAKQASDTQLTSLAALTYAGNGGKFIRLNAGETDFEFAASGGGTVDGSGTTNELTYWVDADTLGALAVATYPSLTELAYVKGVTSAIQTQLNAKQASGSYLTSANIVETITNGVTTNAPSENAVFDALALKAPLTSPTFATSVTGSYLTASEMLITDASKNIVSAAVATYPSLTELTYLKGVTSAIQTQLGTKAPSASPTFTGTVILPKTLEIQDTTGDHQYVLAVSELIADRTVTLPLLTTADEFVFKDHAVTLTNKTIALGSNTVSGTKAQFNTACTDGNFIFEGDAVSAASTSGVSAGPASSSTQTITHGLGKTPSIIRIHGIGEMQSSSNSRTPSVSHGTYNSTGNRCIRMQGGQGTFAPATSTTYAVYLEEMTVAGVATGVVQNVGATTFDIVWTLTGTDVSDTTAFLWEAE